jgi:mannose-6-phosphate isomerase-like protein (cupin superfamily)
MTATRYAGPRSRAESPTKLSLATLERARFHREGLRENFEYRDLGLAAATGGRLGAKHTRAIKPFEAATGWHWHDMDAHIVYVLRGWLTFRFAGTKKPITVGAGACLNQPAGVPHNVIDYSDDLELIEINVPADYATVDLAAADLAAADLATGPAPRRRRKRQRR